MPHSIKVSDEVYKGLQAIQGPREVYSEVVGRLLDIRRQLVGLDPLLTGHKAYQEFRQRQTAPEPPGPGELKDPWPQVPARD